LLGLDEREVREVGRAWLDAKRDEEARLEAWAKGLFKTEPETPEPKIADEPGPEKVKEAGEALKRPLDFVQFAADKPDHDPEPALLSYSAPFDNARAFARRFCWRANALALFAWGDKFWEMNGGAYQPVPGDGLHALIWRFLDASHKTAANQRVRFIPKPLHVNDLFTALKAGLALPAWCEPPMSLDTGERLGSVMMFRNMLVDLRSEEQIKPSPMNWIHHQVGYDWDPTAKAPNWLAFLESIFPGDQEAKDCVEEALGLSMTDDLTFQKGMALIGKTRGGKGTILEVLTGLVGDDAVISLEFGKWVLTEFGLQGAIGKKVLAFPDVRLKRSQWYGRTFDPGGLDHKSISELLKITAGDRISIPRKNIGAPWEGKLRGKVWIASNKMLNFNDPTLPTRFIKIDFKQSFLGREDRFLSEKLKLELPGIAARAVRAYARLRERGVFIQPRSSDGLEREIAKGSDPSQNSPMTRLSPTLKVR
jgi:putative DNA primase/helicase